MPEVVRYYADIHYANIKAGFRRELLKARTEPEARAEAEAWARKISAEAMISLVAVVEEYKPVAAWSRKEDGVLYGPDDQPIPE